MQASLLILGCVVIALVGLQQVGGPAALYASVGPEYFEFLRPADDPLLPWTALPGIALHSAFFAFCSVAVLQRALGARSVYDAKMGMLFGAFLKIVTVFMLAIPGSIAAKLYPQAGDTTMPVLVRELLPALGFWGVVLSGLVLAGLVSAVMSSADAGVCAISSVIALDIYPSCTRQTVNESRVLFVGKLAADKPRPWYAKGHQPLAFKPATRTPEHGSYIVEGLETGRVYRGHFNVPNQGTITNLPADASIEAPGYVDRNDINLPRVGDLPLGCTAVCSASISVQRLAVEAAVHGHDSLLRQAFMMDPLVGAVCNPPEIWQMVDEMLIAGARGLPQYRRAIAAARKRFARGPLLPTNGFAGTARRQIRTLKELAALKGNPRQGH